jgi:type I restriction enzyme M protein
MTKKTLATAITSNEREFCGELNTILNELLATKRFDFERSSIETSLRGITTRFPDVVVWNNRESEVAAFFIEAKQPNVSAVQSGELAKAREKAHRLGVKYFVTWNLTSGFIWEVLSDASGQQVVYSFNTTLTDINEIFTPSKRGEIRAKAELILQFFADLKRGVHKPKLELDQTFFTAILRNANRLLTPAVMTELRKRSSKEEFRKKVRRWRLEQGIADETGNDDDMLVSLSGHVCYKLLVKILFYEILRRFYSELPALTGKDGVSLEAAFKAARNIDYESIFGESDDTDLTSSITLSQEAQSTVDGLIEQLDVFNFRNISLDIVGGVFEQLIDPRTRHTLGQYYTNDRLEDFIIAFTVRNDSDKTLDPACGTGSFLVRGYDRLKTLKLQANPNSKSYHAEILELLWGFDISSFAAELATLNLARLKLDDTQNYPKIRREDFFNVDTKTVFKFPPPRRTAWNMTETIDVAVGEFDAVIGNPPYIRQELIEKSKKDYKNKIAKRLSDDWLMFRPNGVRPLELDGKADIYASFFVHASSLLREGGRLGFVTSRAWLDTEYGHTLQKFFLRNFKLIAVIESRVEPWFIDASISTAVVILERCSDKADRSCHVTSFVSLKKPLAELFPFEADNAARWTAIEQFAFDLQDTAEAQSASLAAQPFPKPKTTETENHRTRYALQDALETEVFNAASIVKWGHYLQAPDVYYDILETCKDRLVSLETVADVQRGYTTGINDFFYIETKELDIFKIEKKYLKPIIKTFKELPTLVTSKAEPKFVVFYCHDGKDDLRGTNALKYIEAFENTRNKDGVKYKDIESVKNRKQWYALDKRKSADMFFPALIGERYLVALNDKKYLADKRLYDVSLKDKANTVVVWAALNASLTRLFLEFAGQGMIGDITALDIDVNETASLPIPSPDCFGKKDIERLKKIMEKISGRAVQNFEKEMTLADRKELDTIMLNALGLNAKKFLPRIYEATQELIKSRLEITKMMKKQKSAAKERDIETFIANMIKELPPDVRLSQFPAAFISPTEQRAILPLPQGEWYFAEMFGEMEIRIEKKLWKSVPKETAAFLNLAHRLQLEQVAIPDKISEQSKATLAYQTLAAEYVEKLKEAVFSRVDDLNFGDQIVHEILHRYKIVLDESIAF